MCTVRQYQIKMIGENETGCKLDLRQPSQELLKLAKEKIGEDPNTRCQMVEEFKDMIFGRGECMPSRTDDGFLLRFLRARKFSLESAYKLFVNYHAFREENPHFVEDVDLKCLERAGQYDVINVPPYLDQTGRRILLYKVSKWDPENFTTDDFFRATLLILELAMLEERAQILGGICIIDCSGISMQHVLYCTPSIARKIVQIAVTSHPMKLEAMHIIHQSWMFELVFNIFKPFLHEKMKDRIYFHGDDMESLHKHVDPKYLPDIYGGLQPHYNYCDWIDWFKNTKEVVQELRLLGYNL